MPSYIISSIHLFPNIAISHISVSDIPKSNLTLTHITVSHIKVADVPQSNLLFTHIIFSDYSSPD